MTEYKSNINYFVLISIRQNIIKYNNLIKCCGIKLAWIILHAELSGCYVNRSSNILSTTNFLQLISQSVVEDNFFIR